MRFLPSVFFARVRVRTDPEWRIEDSAATLARAVKHRKGRRIGVANRADEIGERFKRAVRRHSMNFIIAVLAGLLVTGIVSKWGARAVADILDKIPWGYFGIAAAALVGLFLGGLLIEWRAVNRSDRLLHWLARNAPENEDMDRAEWVFGFLRKYKPRIEGQLGPMLSGKVISKRVLDDETGLLQIDEDPSSCWCVFDRSATIFREATVGEKVATLALPLGVVGHEVFFLDVSETLPPAGVGSQ